MDNLEAARLEVEAAKAVMEAKHRELVKAMEALALKRHAFEQIRKAVLG